MGEDPATVENVGGLGDENLRNVEAAEPGGFGKEH